MPIRVNAPLSKTEAAKLRAGDEALISGYIYTARDAAHKRICEMLDRGEEPPFELRDSVIYYVGPTPAREGEIIGSCGPTTSGRMDAYAPRLIALGETGMIGKGERSAAVVEAMKEHTAVYFAAVGGAGALLAETVKERVPVAFPDLGAEEIVRLRVENFPAVVVIDSLGGNAYRLGREKYEIK